MNFLSHLQHLSNRLLDQASLKRILSHLEGIDSDVTAEMNKMSISVESSGLQHELQDILQTFNKPFNENEEVLVISLGLPFEDCPGMLPEEKVGPVSSQAGLIVNVLHFMTLNVLSIKVQSAWRTYRKLAPKVTWFKELFTRAILSLTIDILEYVFD